MPFGAEKEYGPLPKSRFLAQAQELNVSNCFGGRLG